MEWYPMRLIPRNYGIYWKSGKTIQTGDICRAL